MPSDIFLPTYRFKEDENREKPCIAKV
jgi:hypothetical protein